MYGELPQHTLWSLGSYSIVILWVWSVNHIYIHIDIQYTYQYIYIYVLFSFLSVQIVGTVEVSSSYHSGRRPMPTSCHCAFTGHREGGWASPPQSTSTHSGRGAWEIRMFHLTWSFSRSLKIFWYIFLKGLTPCWSYCWLDKPRIWSGISSWKVFVTQPFVFFNSCLTLSQRLTWSVLRCELLRSLAGCFLEAPALPLKFQPVCSNRYRRRRREVRGQGWCRGRRWN